MENTKVGNKSVIISGNLHTDFKVMCKGKNLKIGGLIEDLIRVYLQNPQEVQKMIDGIYQR
jgi:hypothetical protein